MAWRNESPQWIGSNALVLAHAQLKRREAFLRAAFADKECGLLLRRLADVVVDLSEMAQAIGRAPEALGCVPLAHADQVQLGSALGPGRPGPSVSVMDFSALRVRASRVRKRGLTDAMRKVVGGSGSEETWSRSSFRRAAARRFASFSSSSLQKVSAAAASTPKYSPLGHDAKPGETWNEPRLSPTNEDPSSPTAWVPQRAEVTRGRTKGARRGGGCGSRL